MDLAFELKPKFGEMNEHARGRRRARLGGFDKNCVPMKGAREDMSPALAATRSDRLEALNCFYATPI